MAFYAMEHTYTDTDVHKEVFMDQFSGIPFTPKRLIIRAKITNTGDVYYYFVKGGFKDTLEPGQRITIEGIDLNGVTEYYIQLATANDVVRITAW